VGKTGIGFHTKELRDRAFQRARGAFEQAMKMPETAPMKHYNLGYLQAISDLAHDQGEEELAKIVQNMWAKADTEGRYPSA
jgi:L-asparaginase II